MPVTRVRSALVTPSSRALQPIRARGQASLVPFTPPPMITTWALCGRVRRSVIALDVVEQGAERCACEAPGRALEAFGGPGPEVIVDRARGVLDRAPQRPP